MRSSTRRLNASSLEALKDSTFFPAMSMSSFLTSFLALWSRLVTVVSLVPRKAAISR
jgi:hypothetical protein